MPNEAYSLQVSQRSGHTATQVKLISPWQMDRIWQLHIRQCGPSLPTPLSNTLMTQEGAYYQSAFCQAKPFHPGFYRSWWLCNIAPCWMASVGTSNHLVPPLPVLSQVAGSFVSIGLWNCTGYWRAELENQVGRKEQNIINPMRKSCA